METTERVVEAYVRYLKRWATIPNIRCDGQYEIDLLAIDLVNHQRYHIESGVSVSGSFSRLTNKPFSSDALKQRVKQAGQRRTFGYFLERKFGHPCVADTLAQYGFKPGEYERVIVSWGWTTEVEKLAVKHRIQLWDFRQVLQDIANEFKEKRIYFTDDTLRTLHLFALANRDVSLTA